MVDLTRVTNKLIRKSIFIRITYGHHCLSAPFERLPDSDPYYCNPSMKVLPETTRKEHTHTRTPDDESFAVYVFLIRHAIHHHAPPVQGCEILNIRYDTTVPFAPWRLTPPEY